MRSTLVMRQESLATGVSATGTEVEGGESTWGYFGLFSLSILGGGEFQSGRQECRKEVRHANPAEIENWIRNGVRVA